jgi:hypothetical protein
MTDAPTDLQRRNTAIALGVCVGLLFWGVIARVWFSRGFENVGLFGIETCAPFCTLKLWTDLRAPGEITALGFSAALFGLKAVALAAHAFAMVLKRRPERIKRRWLLVSTAITVAASVGFLVRMLGESWSLSYPGFFAIFGGIGVLVLAYRIKP